MQMQSMGGIGGLMGMMPGVAKMKNQIANAGLDDKTAQASDGDHQLDDAAGAAQPRPAEEQPQEAHRRGLRHQRRKQINKLLKMHRGMADMMKAMGSGKRGPMAGLGQMMGFGGGGAPSPEQMAELAKKMPGGKMPGMPGAAAGLPPIAAEHAGAARPGGGKFPGLAGPARRRKEEMT